MKSVQSESYKPQATNRMAAASSSSETKFLRSLGCEIITDLERLDVFAEDWRRLAGNDVSPFHTFGWNRAWYRHLAGRKKSVKIAVFVFWRKGAVVGILPCYQKGSELRLAGDEDCDYQDILVREEKIIPQMLARVFTYLKKENCDLHFCCLADTGKLLHQLNIAAKKLEYPNFSRKSCPCPWFEMGENGETFLAKQKTKVRKRVRAALRKMEKHAPGYRCRIYEEGEINPNLIERIADLHIRNQYRKQGKSVFESQKFRDFVAEAALRRDVGISIVTLENEQGELIAFDLGFQRGKRFSVYLGSFEAEYSSCSPGTVLLYLQIEEWTKRGVEIYDFLCGNESYKYDYADGEYLTVCQRVFRKKPLSHFRIALLETKMKTRHLAKKVLEKLGLLHFFVS